jgi:hypothetical protein
MTWTFGKSVLTRRIAKSQFTMGRLLWLQQNACANRAFSPHARRVLCSDDIYEGHVTYAGTVMYVAAASDFRSPRANALCACI